MFQFVQSVGTTLETLSQFARFLVRIRDAAIDVYRLMRPHLPMRASSTLHANSDCADGHCAFDHAIVAQRSLQKRRPFTHCPSCPRLKDTHVKWIRLPCDQCPCSGITQAPGGPKPDESDGDIYPEDPTVDESESDESVDESDEREEEECENCMAEEDNPSSPCPYHTDYMQPGYSPEESTYARFH
jgi:hypothetical protein